MALLPKKVFDPVLWKCNAPKTARKRLKFFYCENKRKQKEKEPSTCFEAHWHVDQLFSTFLLSRTL